MSSLIPGYNYDIFISYRQKDNKYDGWVTEFVDNLKKELEATFKEDISVYFDINPHDGLLEIHDVDESLKEKLKCLIFIPIISRTYCDPKSFAWEHEFKAFVELASQDQFGLKIKLPNGNVASRVLPVQIYNLDNPDIKLFESVLGGFLRGLEFIYKESGVNRPLKPDDDDKVNLNRTKYRNQINKLSNAIKEIIQSLAGQEQEIEEVHKEAFKTLAFPKKSFKTHYIWGSVILLALIVAGLFFIPKLFKPSERLEKSIAVLPFRNDSPDDANQHFIDGTMESILDRLCKIGNLTVISRTSVEQFRNTAMSIPEIAKILNVNYILEGSGQKYESRIRLTVQLIDASDDRHIWSSPYEGDTGDIFKLQSKIAEAIAEELKTIITPEEKKIIEKIPTDNLTAYDFYLRGREEEFNTLFKGGDREGLNRAEGYFRKALEYDRSYAQAYTGLASVYWFKHFWKDYFSENFMDSVLILANIALSYDNQLSDGYTARGQYYRQTGKTEQAIKEFNKAITINPNDWMAYFILGNLYSNMDLTKSIMNYEKAITINRGDLLPGILESLAWAYHHSGFIDKFKNCIQEILELNGDSTSFYRYLATSESFRGNYGNAIEYSEKAYMIDSTMPEVLRELGYNNMFLGRYRESLKYYKKYAESLEASGNLAILEMNRIGYVYWKNNYKETAESYFDKEVEYCNNEIKLQRGSSLTLFQNYNLAGVYAFRGERDSAYANLRRFDQRQWMPLNLVVLIKDDPLFDGIRREQDFQHIVSDVESKYQSEHERVRKWLKSQGQL